jgi:glycosyltransferase involved in cell wall biosynthesis
VQAWNRKILVLGDAFPLEGGALATETLINMPSVDIIIPTYNRARLLASAIASAISQTYTALKIIVVDDASRDNTRDVVLSFNDSRLKYLRHDVNRGEAAARNTGIACSQSEYVAFLDDDDQWFPQKTQLQVELMENRSPRVAGVYSGWVAIRMENGGIISWRVPQHRGEIYPLMAAGNVIGTPSTVLLRRRCLEEVGPFDESIPYGLDYDMWIRLAERYEFEYISEPLVKYYIHENQISNNPEIMIKGHESMLRKHEVLFASDRKGQSRRYLQLGSLHYVNHQRIQSCKWLLKAIRLHPACHLNYYVLGLSLLGRANVLRIKRILRSPLL